MALTDKNLYAYCDNNPVVREDGDGEFWVTAILVGAAVGVVSQYISDIVCNYASGERGINGLKPTSSVMDYIASGLGGAVAAIPVGGIAGTLAFGAIGNVSTDALKGNLNSFESVIESAAIGSIANGLGYGVSKGMARLKTNKILSMNRMERKNYLTDIVYKNSRSLGNVNMHTFTDNPLGTVERTFSLYKYGIYSTVSSTLSLSVYGALR